MSIFNHQHNLHCFLEPHSAVSTSFIDDTLLVLMENTRFKWAQPPLLMSTKDHQNDSLIHETSDNPKKLGQENG